MGILSDSSADSPRAAGVILWWFTGDAAGDDGLNHRPRKFAEPYLSGHFAKQAAILASYSADNAARIAARLLKTPAIAANITAERDRLRAESFNSPPLPRPGPSRFPHPFVPGYMHQSPSYPTNSKRVATFDIGRRPIR